MLTSCLFLQSCTPLRHCHLCSAAGLIGQSQEARCKAQESHCAQSATVEKELGRIDRSHSDPSADHFAQWDEMSHPSMVWTEQGDREENMS